MCPGSHWEVVIISGNVSSPTLRVMTSRRSRYPLRGTHPTLICILFIYEYIIPASKFRVVIYLGLPTAPTCGCLSRNIWRAESALTGRAVYLRGAVADIASNGLLSGLLIISRSETEGRNRSAAPDLRRIHLTRASAASRRLATRGVFAFENYYISILVFDSGKSNFMMNYCSARDFRDFLTGKLKLFKFSIVYLPC